MEQNPKYTLNLTENEAVALLSLLKTNLPVERQSPDRLYFCSIYEQLLNIKSSNNTDDSV